MEVLTNATHVNDWSQPFTWVTRIFFRSKHSFLVVDVNGISALTSVARLPLRRRRGTARGWAPLCRRPDSSSEEKDETRGGDREGWSGGGGGGLDTTRTPVESPLDSGQDGINESSRQDRRLYVQKSDAEWTRHPGRTDGWLSGGRAGGRNKCI